VPSTSEVTLILLGDAILEPKPIQKPRPPLMIAGGGE
jgi:alkanesulfonate monooxygenase SsuD/methylene tetrahydromethanopterin reductase-like flavin-dependent oxidoreductase (luciferase family)